MMLNVSCRVGMGCDGGIAAADGKGAGSDGGICALACSGLMSMASDIPVG